MNKVIYLWKENAPYTEFSMEQAQPSIKCFEVEMRKTLLSCFRAAAIA